MADYNIAIYQNIGNRLLAFLYAHNFAVEIFSWFQHLGASQWDPFSEILVLADVYRRLKHYLELSYQLMAVWFLCCCQEKLWRCNFPNILLSPTLNFQWDDWCWMNWVSSFSNQLCNNFNLCNSIVRLASRGSKYELFRRPYKIENLPEKDLEEKFIRGYGPGGQKVNKVSTFHKYWIPIYLSFSGYLWDICFRVFFIADIWIFFKMWIFCSMTIWSVRHCCVMFHLYHCVIRCYVTWVHSQTKEVDLVWTNFWLKWQVKSLQNGSWTNIRALIWKILWEIKIL